MTRNNFEVPLALCFAADDRTKSNSQPLEMDEVASSIVNYFYSVNQIAQVVRFLIIEEIERTRPFMSSSSSLLLLALLALVPISDSEPGSYVTQLMNRHFSAATAW